MFISCWCLHDHLLKLLLHTAVGMSACASRRIYSGHAKKDNGVSSLCIRLLCSGSGVSFGLTATLNQKCPVVSSYTIIIRSLCVSVIRSA